MEEMKAQLKAFKIENQMLKEQSENKKIFQVKRDPKLPVFKADGKGIPANDFLIEITDFLEDCGLSEKDKVSLLKEQIQGDAYIDICNRNTREQLKSHKNILKTFENIFCKADSVETLMKSLWSIVQGRNESVREYSRNLLSTNRRIRQVKPGNEVDESVMRTIFIKGIYKDTLRLQLETLACNTDTKFDQLLDFAVSFEREFTVSTNVNTHIASQPTTEIENKLTTLETAIGIMSENIKDLTLCLTKHNTATEFKTCNICNKTGHTREQCWYNNSSSGANMENYRSANWGTGSRGYGNYNRRSRGNWNAGADNNAAPRQNYPPRQSYNNQGN
jgi:hypothetical protein